MLNIDDTVLVVVDVQGKLATLMYEHELLFRNLQAMIKGARLLELPVLWLEQLPDKLGPTIPQLQEVLSDLQPMTKSTFSGCGASGFLPALEATGCKKVLLVGIEAHICVYQTAADLLALGYEVEIVADAVSSRLKASKKTALAKMSALGAGLTTVEMALFELMKTADVPVFRDIGKLIK